VQYTPVLTESRIYPLAVDHGPEVDFRPRDCGVAPSDEVDQHQTDGRRAAYRSTGASRPDYLNVVRLELAIRSQDGNPLEERLGNQETIKGIPVVRR
jgi:hypothetical protein